MCAPVMMALLSMCVHHYAKFVPNAVAKADGQKWNQSYAAHVATLAPSNRGSASSSRPSAHSTLSTSCNSLARKLQAQHSMHVGRAIWVKCTYNKKLLISHTCMDVGSTILQQLST